MHTVDSGAFDIASQAILPQNRARSSLTKTAESLALGLLQARNDERKLIARELHDVTAQLLLELDFALNLIGREGESASAIDARAVVARLQDQMRCLSYILHPPELERHGLVGALEALSLGMAARSGIEISFQATGHRSGLRPELELAMLRIAQEALMNVFKHSGSGRADMRLQCTCNWLCLRVRDYGIGRQARGAIEAGLGVGMRSMKERMDEIGGRIRVSLFEQGTAVSAIVRKPLRIHG